MCVGEGCVSNVCLHPMQICRDTVCPLPCCRWIRQPTAAVSFTQFLNADAVRMFFSSLPSHTMSVDSCGRVRQKSLRPLRGSYATSSAWDKQLLSNSITSSSLHLLFIMLGSIVAGLSGVSLKQQPPPVYAVFQGLERELPCVKAALKF